MIITRTPLRISIGGGGTDLPSYYERFGGFVISAAIRQYIYITVHRTFVPNYIIKYSHMETVDTVDQIKHPIIRCALRRHDVAPYIEIASMADMLGFLFLLVGIWWMVRAFLERALNPTWWLGLISGILMTAIAFWTAGQFFITKAYVLLVFAGIWALMHGITDIVRAFGLRSLRSGL